ncbi:MAG: hypothetical protein ACI82A_000966 [Candidatus Azotimanducaceae bacterium]
MNIDHLMWACADLDLGIAELDNLTGITAEYSGRHTGQGTRNALMSLGADCYLEIIAPDPQQSLEGTFGGRLARLTSSGLLAWAVACTDLERHRLALGQRGHLTTSVQTTMRENPAGEQLTWQLLFVRNLSGAPFFIDWLNCVHPATTSPLGCELKQLTLKAPDTSGLNCLMGEVDRLSLESNDLVGLHARIESPNGEVLLTPLVTSVQIF